MISYSDYTPTGSQAKVQGKPMSLKDAAPAIANSTMKLAVGAAKKS
jgi:hypothetical protein